jgi:hypothetical protein
LEFGADEGVIVVGAEEGFGGFGEVLAVVGQGVGFFDPPIDAEDVVVEVMSDGVIEGGFDVGVGGAEDPVVIGVGELVEEDAGLDLGPGEEVSGVAEFDGAGLIGVEAVGSEPVGGAMVDAAGEAGVVEFEPDGDGAEGA